MLQKGSRTCFEMPDVLQAILGDKGSNLSKAIVLLLHLQFSGETKKFLHQSVPTG